MPKIVDKDKMIHSIMQAALQAFVKHGFHNTTMDKIAKEAGIAKGTLYLYFDSKELLSQNIMEKHFKKLQKKIFNETHFETLDTLLQHIKKNLMTSKEDLLFIPIFFEAFGPSFASASFSKKIAQFFDEIGEYYADHLTSLCKQNQVDNSINPSALGRVLTSMLDGVLLHRGLFKHRDEEYDEMVSEVIKLLQMGLTSKTNEQAY